MFHMVDCFNISHFQELLSHWAVHPCTRIFNISDAAVGSHLHLNQNSSFEVELMEKLNEKYSKSQKYLIIKEEYYKRLESRKTATKVLSMKSHHQ